MPGATNIKPKLILKTCVKHLLTVYIHISITFCNNFSFNTIYSLHLSIVRFSLVHSSLHFPCKMSLFVLQMAVYSYRVK